VRDRTCPSSSEGLHNFAVWRRYLAEVAPLLFRKGEKAITLCQPVTVKRTTQGDDGTEETDAFTRFVYRPHWFVLAQTEGAELPLVPIPAWDRAKALESLNVSEVPFDACDGNVSGAAL